MSARKTKPTKSYAILKRAFDRGRWRLTPDGAQSLLELAFDDDDRARMHELSRKSSAGALTYEEQREADFYEFLGQFLDLLHSKARLTLKKAQ